MQGHRDFVIKTLLHGLTGPVNGTTFTQVMVPMGTQKDDWVAAIASYVRNSFGNTASFVHAGRRGARAGRDRERARRAGRSTRFKRALPTLLLAQPTWKATASHNAAIAGGALTLGGLDDGRAAGSGHVVAGGAAGGRAL